MSVPSREVDEMMPWLDYSIDGSFQTEYGSDFLHELTENDDLPASNNFTLLEKRSNGGNQMFRDSHKNSAEPVNVSKDSSAEQVETAGHKGSTSQLYPPSSNQCQTSFVTVRSGESNITENNNPSNGNQGVPYSEIDRIPSSSSDFSSLKVQKQDPILPGNVSNVMNFSHFARPAAIVRANLQNIGMKSSLISASARSNSMGIKNRGEASTSSNPTESTLVNSSGECSKEPVMHCQKVVEQSKANLKPLQPKSLEQNTLASKQSEPACKENGIKNDQRSNQVLGDGGTKGQTGAEKGMEAAVASSSICSGNGADRGSDDLNRDLKRKSRDTEDSECHSEVS
jgi:phytochrome-interacting factor 3